MPTPREEQIARALSTEDFEQADHLEPVSAREEQIAAAGEPCGCTTFSFTIHEADKVVATCARCGTRYVNEAPPSCTMTAVDLDTSVLR